ncbi:4'-phosphopantetheinyl transferase superfamily protein [Microbacterium sp. NPDC019599]|uniref:4'-phosphopantetheinyl transferase family protein n=1 Tax=Microbacterium sp. NPDC019599 TaxID=3154690 RepID=UPI003406908C
MSAWHVLAGPLALRAGTVDVVLAPLSHRLDDESLLDAGELRRADRLRRTADRALFVATHATRRRVLSSMLGCGPAEVVITTEPGGKPHLAEDTGVVFNDSGCADAVVVAATVAARGDVRLGADLELPDPGLDVHDLLPVVCAPAEERVLRETPASLLPERFLRLFTTKEALLKAVGVGLTIEVREVVLDVAGDLRPVALPAQLGHPHSWWIRACEPPTGHVVIVAAHGFTRAPELRCWLQPSGSPAPGS